MNAALILASRRSFLRFLASSPAVCAAPPILAQNTADPYAPQVIAEAGDAINVFDFHEVARQVLMPGHYTYMALGTDDADTLRANREGFEQFRLRMRRHRRCPSNRPVDRVVRRALFVASPHRTVRQPEGVSPGGRGRAGMLHAGNSQLPYRQSACSLVRVNLA